jgi:hypothetical protein
MAKKKTHGGARKNAGRKPIEDKKQQVNLFVLESIIDGWGGKKSVQQACYEMLSLRGGKK